MKRFLRFSAPLFGVFLLAIFCFAASLIVFIEGIKDLGDYFIKSDLPLPAMQAPTQAGALQEGAVQILPFYPRAVVIDNKDTARPLSGINEAELVYEAPVEGGITRFLAIYLTDKNISKIGPVRSARPYFVDWAQEFKAIFVHAGGSPEALSQVRNGGIFDLDEFFNTKYFLYDSSRFRPHHIFTSFELLQKSAKEKFDIDAANSFELPSHGVAKELVSFEGSEGREIEINFSPQNQVRWVYNEEADEYFRWEGNKLAKDANDENIKTKNLVIQLIDILIIDSLSRRKIKTIGQGEIIVFQDGRMVEGVWKKESEKARTKFYGKEGKEIDFNSGSIWIEIIGDKEKVKYGNN